MMVMRERSGRSGRRRGSQKPGIAIGSDVTAGVFGTPGPTFGGGGPNCRGVWACATVAATSSTTMAHAEPPRGHVLNFDVIPLALPRNRADHILAVAVGLSYSGFDFAGQTAVKCRSISCTGILTKSLSTSARSAPFNVWE